MKLKKPEITIDHKTALDILRSIEVTPMNLASKILFPFVCGPQYIKLYIKLRKVHIKLV